METFKSFNQLPGGEEVQEVSVDSKPKRIEQPSDMLEMMGLSFKDMEKPTPKDFFELAIKKCGVMSERLEKVVIPFPLYQKTFMEYFKLKGSKGKDEFNAIFDKMTRRNEIGIKSLDKKSPILLFIPREE